jgi:hypothetical protein
VGLLPAFNDCAVGETGGNFLKLDVYAKLYGAIIYKLSILYLNSIEELDQIGTMPLKSKHSSLNKQDAECKFNTSRRYIRGSFLARLSSRNSNMPPTRRLSRQQCVRRGVFNVISTVRLMSSRTILDSK